MRVIGAGWGRTGSSSLKAALERLGFGPCYHMSELLEHPEHAPLWQGALAGESVAWDQVFGAYQATTDMPGSLFWRELAEAYPVAKVILTVRDPERWYESMRKTVLAPENRAVISTAAPTIARIGPALLARALPEGAEDRDTAIRAFERHNREVREAITADRLLVHEIGDGWDPICDFLGASRPDEPFPHLNDAETFRAMIRGRAEQAH